jgi:CDP-archaeol synthase
MSEFLGVGYLLIPLLGGAVFHGLCMKFGWFGFLALPVDGGRAFRGKPLFGPNKTVRGILCVGVGTSFVFGLQTSWLHRVPSFRSFELFDYSQVNGWLLGFALGTAAMLSELPNSYVKRRLNITAGGSARGAALPLFYLFDQLDLLLGVWIMLAFVSAVTLERIGWSVVIVFVAHQLVTLIGHAAGVRTSKSETAT